MKPVRTNDAPRMQNELREITEHLIELLKSIRKKKLANDLIGDDERSKDFDVEDFDAFADELSAGVELTSRDHSRIRDRAAKLLVSKL
ncbi:hypothetical protein [Yoonia sp. MH D7]